MGIKVTNNAYGVLAAGITASDTTLSVGAGEGARFPSLAGSDYFYLTLVDTANNIEIVKVTARSTNTMTIVRAQDGTTAKVYPINSRAELRPCAAMFAAILAEAAVADGDKGDIVVSGGGATWTLGNDVVSYAKIQNVTAGKVLGRNTSGAGDVQELPISVDSSGNVQIDGKVRVGTSITPTSYGMAVALPFVFIGNQAEPFGYKFSTDTFGVSSAQAAMLQITVPAESQSIFIKGSYFGSRNYVLAAGAGSAKVGEFYMMIQRAGSGFNVVLDNNLGAKNWEATTSVAQSGGIDKLACAPTLSRAGAEANTAAQVVNITAVLGAAGANTGFVAVNWEILSHRSNITITTLTG